MRTLIAIALILLSLQTVHGYGMNDYENRKLELERVKFCMVVHTEVTYRGVFNPYHEIICRDVFKIIDKREIERQQLLIKRR